MQVFMNGIFDACTYLQKVWEQLVGNFLHRKWVRHMVSPHINPISCSFVFGDEVNSSSSFLSCPRGTHFPGEREGRKLKSVACRKKKISRNFVLKMEWKLYHFYRCTGRLFLFPLKNNKSNTAPSKTLRRRTQVQSGEMKVIDLKASFSLQSEEAGGVRP